MPQQKGVTSQLVIGEESTFKTLASAGFLMPFNSMNLKGSQAVNTPGTLTGTRNPAVPFRGNRDVGGTIVAPLDATAFWYWLQMMFGDPTTTGTGPYVHTFDIGDTMPSYSIEAQYTDLSTNLYYQYTGCKVNNWSMNLGGDGELVSNIDVIGCVDTQATSPFDASPTSMISLDRLDNFEVSLEEGGGALSNALEVSFAVNFGLDPNNYVIGGSGVRGSLPEGIVGVSGNLKTLFEDDTLLDKAEAGTESSLVITVTQSASLKMIIEFNEIQYSRNSPDIPGPQGLLVDLNFQGYYDDHGDASAVVVELTNGDAHA